MIRDDLSGRVAVVTGGGSGIGAAAARRLEAAGARLVVLDVQPAGEAVAAEIRAADGEALFLQVDMIRGQAVQDALDAILAAYGRLDIWVNVAGGSGRRAGDGPADQCTEAGWDYTLDLNLKSTFLGCKAALQAMLPRGSGAIVNISSVLGLVGGDEDFATHAYAASKGGVISLTRAIASYYAPHGIRANVICPGLIATPMSRRAQESQEILDRLGQLQPLTSDFGRPEDVAHAVLYLASDASRFVTGAVLTVDGGWTVR